MLHPHGQRSDKLAGLVFLARDCDGLDSLRAWARLAAFVPAECRGGPHAPGHVVSLCDTAVSVRWVRAGGVSLAGRIYREARLRFVCRPMEPRADRVGGSRGGGAVLDHPGGLGDGVR